MFTQLTPSNESTCSLIEYKMPIDIRLNSYLLIHDKPCKVSNISVCKNGKHGDTKYHFVGYDIFTNKRHETIYISKQQIFVPIVEKHDYRLLAIDNDGFASLLDVETNKIREDLNIGDINFDQNKEINVIVMKSMNIEKIIGYNTVD